MSGLYDRLVYNLKHFKEWLMWALHDERIAPVTEFVEKLITKPAKDEAKISKAGQTKPSSKTEPASQKNAYSPQINVKKQADSKSAKDVTDRQIREVQRKNAKARMVRSFENSAYVKLYNSSLEKIDTLQEMSAVALNWLVNLPNSIQIMMASALVLILGIVGMSILATVPTTLKVKDSLSSMISFKAKVPRIWSTNSATTWNIKNFVYPADSFIESVYKKGTITFSYQSPKVYAEILGAPTIKHVENKYNPLINFETKKFMTAERFIDNYIRQENVGANEIRIFSKDIMDANIIDTLKLQQQKAGENPYIMPAIVTYSYVLNGARYKQMVMTVISSVDKEERLYNEQKQMETVYYRLWKVHFILSYKARLTPYEKYLPVFNKFAQSIQYNENWLNGVKGTIVELEKTKQTPKPTAMPNYLTSNTLGGGMPLRDIGGPDNLGQYEDVAQTAMTRFRIAARNPVYGSYGIEEPYRTILNNFALNSILYKYDDYGITIRMPVKYEFVYRNKETGDVVGTNDSSYKPSSEYIRLRKRGN